MSELPKGWASARLGDLCEIARGGSPRPIKDYITSAPDGINWVKISDATASSKYIYETKEKIRPEGLSKTRLVQDGDFLLSNSMSFGRPYIMRTTGCIHDGWLVLRDRTGALNQDYLYQFLGSPVAYRQFDQLAAGSTVRNLNSDLVRTVEVLVPPLGEQQRIAAMLDSMRARSSRARQELDHVPKLIEHYKQAILSTQIDLATIDAPEHALGELLDVLTSGSRDWAQYYDRGTGVFVLAGNVKPMAFDATPRKSVDPPRDGADARRSRIAMDDILLTIVGAGTGELCRVPASFEDYFVCQSVALLRLKNPRLSRWVELFLNAEAHGKGQIAELIYGQGRPHLSFDDIKRISIKVPSENLVQSAIRKIDRAFAWIDKITGEHARAERLLPKLDQAILAKAFRGELLPQDLNDEPASVLLERIKAERGGIDRESRRRQRG